MAPTGCCPEGSLGPVPLAELEAKGKVISVSPKKDDSKRKPMPFYCVGPETPKRIVLVFGDIYGLESGNHKVVCDSIQSRMGDETAVFLADIFRGCPTVGGWNVLPTFVAHQLVIPSLVLDCKTRLSDDKLEQDLLEVIMPYCLDKCSNVCSVGFCYGGWLASRALALDGCPIKCVVGVHPSWQVETLHGKKEIDLAKKIGSQPILVLPASNDQLKPDSDEVKALAEQRGVDPDKVAVEFPDMVHGFVARGDMKDEKIAEAQTKALNLTCEFLKEHCPIA